MNDLFAKKMLTFPQMESEVLKLLKVSLPILSPPTLYKVNLPFHHQLL
jgi:hypothetical protein